MSDVGWVAEVFGAVKALALWGGAAGLLVLGWIAVIEIKTVGKGQK